MPFSGQFTWNWSKVAVNRVLLNAARAVWSPVFFTHHRPHHVSGVRGPENGSLFFRRIAYVIYSGSCLIPLRRSPSATAIIHKTAYHHLQITWLSYFGCENQGLPLRSWFVACWLWRHKPIVPSLAVSSSYVVTQTPMGTNSGTRRRKRKFPVFL